MRSNFFRVLSIFACFGLVIFAATAWAGCGGGNVFGDGGVLCGTKRSAMEYLYLYYPLFILFPGFIGLLSFPLFEKKWRLYHIVYWIILILMISLDSLSSNTNFSIILCSLLIEGLLFRNSRLFLAYWIVITIIFTSSWVVFLGKFSELRLVISLLIAFILWYWPLHRSKMVLIFGIYISLFHYFIRLLATWASYQTQLVNMALCITLCIIFLISSAWLIYRIYREIKPKEK